MDKKAKPIPYYILLIALLFQALSGVGGGIALILDPTGKSLGIPIEWLQGSPFSNFLLPGLILLFILGIFPIIVSYGIWKRRKWSWLATLAVGIALVIWIIVEILMIGYKSKPPLQLVYGLLGILILILTAMPFMKDYLNNPQA